MNTPVELLARPGHPDFLDLPWSDPLAEWRSDRLVAVARGVSRHVVRFVDYDGAVYALKETELALAEREYHLLRRLHAEGLPVVEAVAVASGRVAADGEPLPAVLVTRFLDYSLPYRYLYAQQGVQAFRGPLLRAMVVLLVRIHLRGFFWGDCSLSNTLFRRDGGELMAYLVDAETGELHAGRLSDGQRAHDLSIAGENIAGGLLDLIEAGRLPADTDPVAILESGRQLYDDLWEQVTGAEEFAAEERFRLEERVRRLNALGFDVDEIAITRGGDGSSLRIQPRVVEEGHHARRLQRLTGLRVQENQARRLLNDIDCFGAWLERDSGRRPVEPVLAHRWLDEAFDPIVARVPPDLRARREAAEVFLDMLDHRWHLSEHAGREVSSDEAIASMIADVLPTLPEERVIGDPPTVEMPAVGSGDGSDPPTPSR
ncbi:MAG: DUF4032 domain-containing protein [Acidimicrobiales bacterium]